MPYFPAFLRAGRGAAARRRARLWWLRRERTTRPPTEAEAARLRARQLQAVLRLTPVAMGINLGNVAVIVHALWGQVAPALLLGWGGGIAIMAAMGLRGWWRGRQRGERSTASARALRRAAWQAGALGMAWGVLPLVTLSALEATAQFFVGTVITGMICAGGFALSSVPWAGTAYVLALGLQAMGALALSGHPQAGSLSVLLGAYNGLVLYTVWAYAAGLRARLLAEATAERQNEVISLLLQDFEEHASDVLLEVDALGRFLHVSPRLAQVLGVPARRLTQRPAWPLLRRWMARDEGGRTAWSALRARLAEGRAFRDHPLPLQTPAGPRWWSLSARPLVDEHGLPAGWRGVATDITERHLAHSRLSWLAHNDSLTGLVNRHQFRERLQALLGAVPVPPLAVICFDLDGFKQVNDQQGHAAGDRLLTDFGQRLLALSRRSDTVARLGGDEFVMLVLDIQRPETLKPLLDRILLALEVPVELAPGCQEPLRCSMGVALAPADGQDVDTLLSHADLALYAAKRAGGQRYSFFSAQMTDGSRRRAQLVQALRGAASRGELHLAYQAQIESEDLRVSGFEALLRWHHPELGDISPVEFIPLAEGAGLMGELGAWVLQAACRDAAQWPAGLSVSVNVSALQLAEPDFLAQVQAAAALLPPGQLELEVTESALIDDADTAVAVLQQLRAQGHRTALDDFGTGYSALGYLRRFRFDTLKIDRSFVRDLSRDAGAQVLVDTILAMAQALGMRTVAEGVETEAEARRLIHRGCTSLQGFLISRPVPAQALPDFLQAWCRRGAASLRPSLSPPAPEAEACGNATAPADAGAPLMHR
ncbi:putative bifunctional diguanylate cyclase/phosphodiesterase [Ideonella livida]|uniref:EAL domain-containing protein n=1 Tax=Ideonella livida TaxID=2707176 RepID=A0A7C9TMN4_9BURK|nr:GGDEF and EAL domain-containing protein [Ideonella livida]NDY92745.1 EAL domain-containing protein [Ideonella livida]